MSPDSGFETLVSRHFGENKEKNVEISACFRSFLVGGSLVAALASCFRSVSNSLSIYSMHITCKCDT